MKKKKKYLIGFCSIGLVIFIFGFLNVYASVYFVDNAFNKNDPMIGRYEFSVTGGSNAYLKREGMVLNQNNVSGTPVRLPGDTGGRLSGAVSESAFEYDDSGNYLGIPQEYAKVGGGGNSSSAYLTKPSSNAKVVKAYLVIESLVDDYHSDILAQKPVTLYGANGGQIKSNPLRSTLYSAYTPSTADSATKVSVSVSDVTSFVQSQGFGKYEVWDIPYWIKEYYYSSTDYTASWKLVTICEDDSLPIRMLNLQYGAIKLEDTPQFISVKGAGITTKNSSDLTGQLLVGGVGGDPDQNTSHVSMRTSPSSSYFDLYTKVNRSNQFFTGIINRNGIPNSSVKILGNRKDGQPFHNNDLVLMDINGSQNSSANGHNAYLVPNSPQVDLRVYNQDASNTSNTISVLGIAVDIDTPTYISKAKHTGTPYDGVPFNLSFHLENNTKTSKMNLGVSGGYALVNVDPNITLNAKTIVATYTDKTDGKKYTLSNSLITVNGNTITVAFGKDSNRISQVGDTLDITMQGTPKQANVNVANKITMYATGFIDETGYNNPFDSTNVMTSAKDSFSTVFNNPPVITTKDKTFYEGQYTKEYWQKTLRMQGISANDKEDGNITSKIKVIADTVDVNKVGAYKVTYQVTDSAGKTAKKDAKITVLFNNPPVITTKDKTFYEGQYTKEYWQKTLRMKDISAADKEDGNLTSKIKVIADTVNVNVPGVYKVTYEVTDKFGKTTKKDAKVTVLFNNPPVITTKDKTFYEGQYTKEYWQKTLRMKDISAADKEDGNLTSKIKVIADSVNVNVPGVYKVTYEVSDKFGKTMKKDAKVTVLFNNPPVITTKDKTFYEGQYTKEYWQNTLRMKDVSATDKENGNLTSKIKVIADSVNVNVPGIYKVTYQVTDAFGKIATKDAKVTVLYNNPPVIEAVDRWFFVSDDINEQILLERVKASDKEDGDISTKVRILESTVKVHEVGEYQVQYEIMDAFGKSAKTSANVYIVENQVSGTQSKRLRFIQEKYLDTLQEDGIWKTGDYQGLLTSTFTKPKTEYDAQVTLTQADIERIKAFNNQYDYSTNSNQMFYEQFQAIWKEIKE